MRMAPHPSDVTVAKITAMRAVQRAVQNVVQKAA